MTPAPASHVDYLVMIPASPEELGTVYELLKWSCALAQQLGQSHCIITVDWAVYAKAQEVVWKRPDKFCHVVLCMGAFHTAKTFLAVLECQLCTKDTILVQMLCQLESSQMV